MLDDVAASLVATIRPLLSRSQYSVWHYCVALQNCWMDSFSVRHHIIGLTLSARAEEGQAAVYDEGQRIIAEFLGTGYKDFLQGRLRALLSGRFHDMTTDYHL